MSTTDLQPPPPPPEEEDSVSIISFDDSLYLEGDYALPGSDVRIQRWLSQQCRFALEVNSREKELAASDNQHRLGPYAQGGPGELLSSVLMKQSTSTVSEEAALRADSPLLGFGGKEVEVEDDGDERTLMDPLHFPSATYVRDLPGDSIIKKHSPHSSHSSNTSSSMAVPVHARSQSTSSSPRKISLALSPLSRRPSLFRQPSLPLLGELDDEQSAAATSQIQPQAICPPIIPQAGRSRAQSNASISSFHLPTSMQFSLQQNNLPAIPSPSPTSPITPTSAPPVARRHSRMPNTPPVSSTLASLSFGAEDDDDVRPLTSPIPRPQSQLHGTSIHHHRHQPPPSSLPSQKIPRAISRSSSTLSLSLLANGPNNRNAVYIDDPLIDIKSGDLVDDDLVTPVVDSATGGEGLGSNVDSPIPEDHRLQVATEEASRHHHHHHTPPTPHSAPPYASGVYFNAIGSSSQVYIGTASVSAAPGTSAKRPTRPPPAPPLIIEAEDETGGLGGIGVIDEDEERGPESDIIRTESEFSSELHDTDVDEGGNKLKRFTSRWSLTSSIEENTTPNASSVPPHSAGAVSAFGVGGGSGNGLFGSKKRRSIGGEREKLVDKEKSIDKEKDKERDKDKDKEKGGEKKRGRLVSFISRISSNIASPPPSSAPYTYEVFEMNTGAASPHHTGGLGFWFSDLVPPPPPMLPPPTRNASAGKKEKEKSKKSKGKEVEESVEKGGEKEIKQVDDKEVDDKPKENAPIEIVEVVPASTPVHPIADGRADANVDSTTTEFKAAKKSASLQLRVDTATHSGGQQAQLQPQFSQPSKIVPNHVISTPLSSSPLPLPLSASPDPQSQSQYLSHATSSKGLKQIASPIMKAFSEGIVSAGPALDFMAARSGSGSIEGGAGMGRARSSSAADLLGRGTGSGGTGYFDLYQHRQHLYRQTQGQPGPSQVQGQGQARQYQQQQLQQQGYQQQQYEDEQYQQRQRSQSIPLQSHYQPQSELHQPPPHQVQPQVDEYHGSVLGGPSSFRSPAVVADVVNPHRPGLVKSISTPLLDMGGSGGGYDYSVNIANADLPSSPVLFAAIPGDHDDEDDDDDEFDDEEDEEDDYGVEAPHGQWRGGGGGLAYDIDRERGMEYKRWEMEHEESLRRQQMQYADEQSPTATTATPRASTDTPPSSFMAPSITRRSGSISNIVGSQSQEQRQLLVQGVDHRQQKLRSVTSLGNISVVGNGGVTVTPAAPTLKSGNGSSKGLRGLVERMKFTTTVANSPSSSSSSSPTIPHMAFTTTTTSSSNASSPSLVHSPPSFITGGSSGGGSPFLNVVNEELFGPEQKRKRKKQSKRKLVINGVGKDDVKGYEAVKAWCESFGEVREMKRTANGHLHVDFRKASVAETVCRLKTQVFIKGAGSVSLSWYTKDKS